MQNCEWIKDVIALIENELVTGLNGAKEKKIKAIGFMLEFIEIRSMFFYTY